VGVTVIGLVALVVLGGVLSDDASGFGEIVGACEPDCTRCHQLGLDEASDLVKRINPEIDALDVDMSPVRGLWQVVIKARGRRGVAYVDFSKQFVITGSIIRANTKENLTNAKLYELSKVDFSAIPLDEALVLGNPEARYKTIVFDDPD
jgi:thiol:disulfide interchange protein DsbC